MLSDRQSAQVWSMHMQEEAHQANEGPSSLRGIYDLHKYRV